MATFYYRSRKTLEPRPGVKYATVYIRQDHQEHQRLLKWLIDIAENIVSIGQIDADLGAWFCTPMADFRRSQRGEYYSPEDILTDMIDQLAHGRDLPEAMLGRWNRLCAGTPWQIEFEASVDTKPQPRDPRVVFA